MAAVANCPQCEHELLIPDGADTAAWAKCPSCRAFFQLRDAVSRDIPQLVLLDDHSPAPPVDSESEIDQPFDMSLELGSSSLFGDDTVVESDISDADTALAPSGPGVEEILARYKQDLDRFAAGLAGASSTSPSESSRDHLDLETPQEIRGDALEPTPESHLTESGEFAAKGIDKWFRSAETVSDIPALPPNEPSASRDTEFIPRKPSLDETEATSEELELAAAESTVEEDSEFSEETGSKSDWSAPFTGELSAAEESPASIDDTGNDVRNDMPHLEPSSERDDSNYGATVEFSADAIERMQADADFEVEHPEAEVDHTEVDEDRPTWDDHDRMEKLLADVEPPASNNWPETLDAETGDEQLEVAHEPEAIETEAFARDADQRIGDEEEPEYALPPIITSPNGKRRRRSPITLLAGTIVGGFLGLGLGYYVLLWILGRDSDFLDVARYIPSAMLPASFQASPSQIAGDAAKSTSSQSLLDGVESTSGSLDTGASSQDDSSETTASYEEPASSSNANDQLELGDRYANSNGATETAESEPLDFEADTADPISDETNVITIADAPTVSVDQLAAGLSDAKQAHADLVRGGLTDDKDTQRAKGLSFTKFSQLAELVTFADRENSDSNVDSIKRDATALFRETLSDPQIRREVGYIASKWIDSTHRKISGVLLTGQVTNQTPTGQLIEIQIDLGTGSPITVVAPAAAAKDISGASGSIAVAGSIIEKPSQRIEGYMGAAPRVIWAGQLIPLD